MGTVKIWTYKDDFFRNCSKKQKKKSADSQLKTIENAKITIQYSFIIDRYWFIIYNFMGKGEWRKKCVVNKT